MTLEECDEAFINGVFLIKDAVLNYAWHGLTPKQIGSRVRELGAKLSDSQVRRYLQGFRAEKLLPEKEVHRATQWRREQRFSQLSALIPMLLIVRQLSLSSKTMVAGIIKWDSSQIHH